MEDNKNNLTGKEIGCLQAIVLIILTIGALGLLSLSGAI